MRIVVCVKQVPDTWSDKRLNVEDKTLDRRTTDLVTNEMDEYALEEALRLREAHGGEVTVLCMGPDTAIDTLRKALSMGADNAIHIVDTSIHGSDAVSTSLVLSTALRRKEFDLVLLGSESSDARMSVVPAMVAERLGLPQMTFAKEVTVDGGWVKIRRVTDDGYELVEAALPAVVSVVEKINEPRYPSFTGIMAAKRKPVETQSLADLGLHAGQVGFDGAYSAVVSFETMPPRQSGVIVKDDDGDSAAALADFLIGKNLI